MSKDAVVFSYFLVIMNDDDATELDIAADDAYKTIVESSQKSAGSANDDEFDFDEETVKVTIKCKETSVNDYNKKVETANHENDSVDVKIKDNLNNLETVTDHDNNVASSTPKDLEQISGSQNQISGSQNQIKDHDSDQNTSTPNITVTNTDGENQNYKEENGSIETEGKVTPNNETTIDEVTEEFAEISFNLPTSDGVQTIDNNQSKVQQLITEENDVTFDEAFQYFQSLDLNEYSEKIKLCIKHTGLSSIWHLLMGPPKLLLSLHDERNLIFTLALAPFDNNVHIHWNILQSIFKILTHRKLSCARFGSHWEQIGFQGNDPSTDLRGCGMLGLLTTLSFISSKNTSLLARKAFTLSQDEIQNFPFCVMSINITRIALQILREEKLNKECNNQQKQHNKYHKGISNSIVYSVFQDIYNAIFYKIYTLWQSGNKTMADSGFVLKEVEDEAKSKPMQLLKYFQSLKTESKSKDDSTKIESFVGIEDL